MLGLAKFSLGSLVATVFAIGSLGGLNLYTYHRFTGESVIATLEFAELAERRFGVTLTAVGEAPRQFELRGDEWQLDARMIKWTDWLTFLGEEPLYRLDRISGRYVAIVDARQNGQTMHDLGGGAGIDVWSSARKAGRWLPGVDAAYGSSVYLPMTDNASYEVSISRTGLLARARDGEPRP